MSRSLDSGAVHTKRCADVKAPIVRSRARDMIRCKTQACQLRTQNDARTGLHADSRYARILHSIMSRGLGSGGRIMLRILL